MTNYSITAAKRIIREKIETTCEKIVVEPGECRYNYKCNRNSVHDALTNDEERIAMCVYIHDDHPIIHFLNITDNKFVDNTLGVWSKLHSYYLIKYIQKDDFLTIDEIFTKYRNELQRNLPFLVRLFNTETF